MANNITINSLPTASTIDPTQDILPIYTASSTATQGINRNTLLGLSSAPVGLTDSQTLTNKVLTNPTVNGATLSGTLSGTYTIGGTPTFPSSVVTLTGSQTLTNKVLTSPTINSPTITNATLSSDTITGFSSSTTGTIYGISVSAGTIGSSALAASSVTTTAIATGIQLPDKMKNPYKFLVYRNSAQNTGSASFALISFDTKLYDTGSNVDVVTNKGRFTAPIAGFYQFSAQLYITASGAVQFSLLLYKNGSSYLAGPQAASGTGPYCVGTGWPPIQLSANDYVEVYCYCSSTQPILVGANNTYFGGYLVSAT
jgi:hypothetical protein